MKSLSEHSLWPLRYEGIQSRNTEKIHSLRGNNIANIFPGAQSLTSKIKQNNIVIR